ncbi:hypothetical protein KFK09_021599 [Dendrobium nobile]|uniref:Uncharacterized protein n=1 Tax=Dendrobium nobile TaxID=94219 RepID=A0A8T3AQK0_DENNO|nr:hypothetical protein KFK09_021599 [Dendrobium nobile]
MTFNKILSQTIQKLNLICTVPTTPMASFLNLTGSTSSLSKDSRYCGFSSYTGLQIGKSEIGRLTVHIGLANDMICTSIMCGGVLLYGSQIRILDNFHLIKIINAIFCSLMSELKPEQNPVDLTCTTPGHAYGGLSLASTISFANFCDQNRAIPTLTLS